MRIRTNFIGINANRNFALHNSRIAKAMERLSTGCRINGASDDPAGLAVSERLKMNLTRLKTDKKNALDYQSMLGVADGSLSEIHSMLNRMTELAKMASNETCSEEDKKIMNAEYQQLLEEIDRIGNGTEFNSYKLFGSAGAANGAAGSTTSGTGAANSSLGESIVFQGNNLNAFLDGLDKLMINISEAAKANDNDILLSLGIDRSNGKTDQENLKSAITRFTKENAQRLLNSAGGASNPNGSQYKLTLSDGEITVDIGKINGESLGLGNTDILTQESAKKAQDALKGAINNVSSKRGSIGAAYNRLEHTISNIANMQENLTSALSRILDADMAHEMMILTKEKLLAQSSMFAMAQANQEPEQVLALLKSI